MNSNLVNLIPQFFDSSGNPLSGGTLETYVAGTSTSLATYPTNSDAIAGTNANSTSISIGSSGYPMSGSNIIGVFLRPGKQYKFILKDSSGTTIYTVDNISNLTDSISDGNGNEVLKLVGVSNAVNEVTITNSATGNAPSIAATGDDTNVGLKIKTKGTGDLELLDGSSNELIKLTTTTNAVNEVTIINAATGNAPSITATGDDTNIDIALKGKGTGKVKVGQATSTGVQLEADQPILDSSGNEYIKFSKTSSAVNEFTLVNSATGNGPTLSATGDDTNIDINFQAKGTGVFNHKGTSTSAAEIRLFEDTDNGTNYMGIKAPAAVTTSKTLILPDGVGSSGQLLRTDGTDTLSWVNQQFELLNTTTASSSASIAFTGLSSTYYAYKVIITHLHPATDNTNLLLRVSTDNGSSYISTTSYAYANWGVAADAGNGIVNGNAAADILIISGVGNATNEAVCLELIIYNPSAMSSTNSFQCNWLLCSVNTANVAVGNFGMGFNASSSPVNAIQFRMSSGNISSGTFKLYGIRAT